MGRPLIATEGDSSVVILDEPGECTRCRRGVAILVNRNGRTCCSACDAETNPAEHQERERSFLERLGVTLRETPAENARASAEGPWFIPA